MLALTGLIGILLIAVYYAVLLCLALVVHVIAGLIVLLSGVYNHYVKRS